MKGCSEDRPTKQEGLVALKGETVKDEAVEIMPRKSGGDGKMPREQEVAEGDSDSLGARRLYIREQVSLTKHLKTLSAFIVISSDPIDSQSIFSFPGFRTL